MIPSPFRLGLRAQIMVVLCISFTGSFLLIAVAAIPILEHVRALDRVRAVSTTAQVLAAFIDTGPTITDHESWGRVAEALSQGTGLTGAQISSSEGAVFRWGVVGEGRSVRAQLASGGEVRLWVSRPTGAIHASAAQLLLPYVFVAGGFMLLLTFVALTYGIVRPMEQLTTASERLASGGRYEAVPVQGVAEIARLASVYNAMAAQLRLERQNLEDRVLRLEETTTKLRTTQHELVRSEKLASVGRLAAGIAHEIGNPLAAILGFVELLRGSKLSSSEQGEFLQRIHSETERINKIIRDLLDFSRQGVSLDLPAASSDLEAVVENAVRLVVPQKDLSHLTIERRVVEATPAVRGDADQLTQVVLNLLLNAADAIAGEGTIRIEVAPASQPGMVSLVVADTGPGIHPSVAERLFDPFVTTKEIGHGTGLGLAVCHTIIEQLGGSITVTNPTTGGARFEVLLPAA